MELRIRAGDWTTVSTEIKQNVHDIFGSTCKITGTISIGFDLGNYTKLTLTLSDKERELLRRVLNAVEVV